MSEDNTNFTMREDSDRLYSVSWSNPVWSPHLCAANVLDYFCDLSNPFYDRECNNEVIRMQRLSPEQLLCMTGIEFYLHHAQEPILFVIRKQHRISSNQVTPLAYYYIINGTVLQAPDLATLLNSRLHTTISGLNKVLQTLAPCARYHPSDGSYSWDDPKALMSMGHEATTADANSTHLRPGGDGGGPVDFSGSIAPPNLFQVQRVDMLLAEWVNRFPSPGQLMSLSQQGRASNLPPQTSTMSSLTPATTVTAIATSASGVAISESVVGASKDEVAGGGPAYKSHNQPSLVATHTMTFGPSDKKPRVT